MENFILIEPTNVKIIYARNFLLTLCTAVKLQLKGSTSRLKYSVKNLILNHSQQSQRFFVLCVYLWIMCLSFKCGEGKRRNEFAEWHVAWLAEWHNYAECKIWKLAQRNKLNWKACARHCRAFFGANLSEQLLYWFTHLDIYLIYFFGNDLRILNSA